MNSTEHILYENEHFRIEHAICYRIAGFLFVVPTQQINSLSEMTATALSLLGPTLEIAVRSLEKILHPPNIYCTKFGESDGSVHFHVFPRTQSLTSEYQRENSSSGSIDGPRLMSWANAKYLGDIEHGDIKATILSLKEHFRGDAELKR